MKVHYHETNPQCLLVVVRQRTTFMKEVQDINNKEQDAGETSREVSCSISILQYKHPDGQP